MKHWVTGLVLALVLIGFGATPIHASNVETQFLSVVPSTGKCSMGVNLTDGTRYVIEGNFKLVTAANKAENILFQCRGNLVEGPTSSRALRFDSVGATFPMFTCYTGAEPPAIPFVATTNWVLHIAPSGRAFYNCHANPSHPSAPL